MTGKYEIAFTLYCTRFASLKVGSVLTVHLQVPSLRDSEYLFLRVRQYIISTTGLRVLWSASGSVGMKHTHSFRWKRKWTTDLIRFACSAQINETKEARPSHTSVRSCKLNQQQQPLFTVLLRHEAPVWATLFQPKHESPTTLWTAYTQRL